jgi:glycosyltransferase involved in cell wall biosynthesis
MISFIIPAHNEELLLGRTLQSINAAANQSGKPFEVIVVDDASTDGTAAIARRHGAQVISVAHRQISATRNSGARAAVGDLFFFVDADTLLTTPALGAALQAMRRGAVGGGCVFRFDGTIPPLARMFYPIGVVGMRMLKIVGGCCLFCTREAFTAIGGFCERYYAAEELVFANALRRIGRFVVPSPYVITSGRKLRTLKAREIGRVLLNLAIGGPERVQQREVLEIWYGPRQVDPQTERIVARN